VTSRLSWARGPHCPGCRGTWHSRQALLKHMYGCARFDLPAMLLVEARVREGLPVTPELWTRYEAFLEIRGGPGSNGVGSDNAPCSEPKRAIAGYSGRTQVARTQGHTKGEPMDSDKVIITLEDFPLAERGEARMQTQSRSAAKHACRA
jgi:hypothetical protein